MRQLAQRLAPSVLLILLSVVIQIFIFGRHIDGGVVNSLSPTSVDTADYVARAEVWGDIGFREAFRDAYRTPGYPAFLLVLRILTGDLWLVTARLTQLLLTALVPVCTYFVVRRFTNQRFALFSAIGTALYLPLSYFSTILMPESLTTLLIALLVVIGCQESNVDYAFGRWSVIGALVGVLALLKPNNALLVTAAISMVLISYGPLVRLRIHRIVIICLSTLIILLPWTLFATGATAQFVPLSTTSGTNLMLGLGVDGLTGGGPIVRIADGLGLFDPHARERAGLFATGTSAAELDAAYRREAVSIAASRPVATLVFASAKVLHAFGFLPSDPVEVLLGLISIASIGAAVVLWRSRIARTLAAIHIALALVVALQASLFLPNIRFRVSIFDFTALCVISVAIGTRVSRRVT